MRKLPKIGLRAKLFCYTNVRQDGLELYGFSDEEELEIFELFISINGIGPKIALRILSELPIDSVLSAIDKNRPDVLSKISGVGKKTAERIILELRGKIKIKNTQKGEESISIMEINEDLEKALKNLGYKQNEDYRTNVKASCPSRPWGRRQAVICQTSRNTSRSR